MIINLEALQARMLEERKNPPAMPDRKNGWQYKFIENADDISAAIARIAYVGNGTSAACRALTKMITELTGTDPNPDDVKDFVHWCKMQHR